MLCAAQYINNAWWAAENDEYFLNNFNNDIGSVSVIHVDNRHAEQSLALSASQKLTVHCVVFIIMRCPERLYASRL